MKNIILTLVFTVFLGVGLGSCTALGDIFGEDTVLTTADQLEEGQVGVLVPFDQLPESVREQIPEGTALVMATKDQLVANAAYVPVGGISDGEDMGGVIDAIFGIASTFLPALAAWEGVVTLFSRRKRTHYVKAIRAILPTDKTVDLGAAIGSVASALGISHSSENSSTAFEDDLLEES